MPLLAAPPHLRAARRHAGVSAPHQVLGVTATGGFKQLSQCRQGSPAVSANTGGRPSAPMTWRKSR